MSGGFYPMSYLPYNKNLKEFSGELRNESTLGEVLLWKKLRAKQLGYAFNRQKPLLDYIADFYCKPLNLVIEVDGKSHATIEKGERDARKEEDLKSLGVEILRFTEKEVRYSMNDVIRCIQVKISEIEEKNPPSARGGLKGDYLYQSSRF
jgi:very-short-patch-repair endonuclease